MLVSWNSQITRWVKIFFFFFRNFKENSLDVSWKFGGFCSLLLAQCRNLTLYINLASCRRIKPNGSQQVSRQLAVISCEALRITTSPQETEMERGSSVEESWWGHIYNRRVKWRKKTMYRWREKSSECWLKLTPDQMTQQALGTSGLLEMQDSLFSGSRCWCYHHLTSYYPYQFCCVSIFWGNILCSLWSLEAALTAVLRDMFTEELQLDFTNR